MHVLTDLQISYCEHRSDGRSAKENSVPFAHAENICRFIENLPDMAPTWHRHGDHHDQIAPHLACKSRGYRKLGVQWSELQIEGAVFGPQNPGHDNVDYHERFSAGWGRVGLVEAKWLGLKRPVCLESSRQKPEFLAAALVSSFKISI